MTPTLEAGSPALEPELLMALGMASWEAEPLLDYLSVSSGQQRTTLEESAPPSLCPPPTCLFSFSLGSWESGPFLLRHNFSQRQASNFTVSAP